MPTANMNLVLPADGDTDWTTKIATLLGLIDAHDHSSGKGVTIPKGALAAACFPSASVVTMESNFALGSSYAKLTGTELANLAAGTYVFAAHVEVSNTGSFGGSYNFKIGNEAGSAWYSDDVRIAQVEEGFYGTAIVFGVATLAAPTDVWLWGKRSVTDASLVMASGATQLLAIKLS
jgi:hypothetical protein